MVSAEEMKRQARRHEAAGRYDRAVECYERALERQRSQEGSGSAADPALHLSLADLHFRADDAAAALEQYHAAAEHYARSGLIQNAASVHKMSLRLFPVRPEPYVQLAELYLRGGNRDEAREQVARLVEKLESSDELTRHDVARVVDDLQASSAGEESLAALVAMLEDADVLPAAEEPVEPEPEEPAEPEAPAEPAAEPRETPELRVLADAHREPAMEPGPETSGGDGPEEGAAPEDDASLENGTREAAPRAGEPSGEPAADEAGEGGRGGVFRGWDFLGGLRSPDRSRLSRPGRKGGEDQAEPEYAGVEPAADWEEEQAAPSPGSGSDEEGPDAGGPRTLKEGIEDEPGEPGDAADVGDATDAGREPAARARQAEAPSAPAGPGQDAREGTGAGPDEAGGGEPSPVADQIESETSGPEIVKPEGQSSRKSSGSGLQSAAPVEDEGAIRRSRRWNWPPPEEGEEDEDAEDDGWSFAADAEEEPAPEEASEPAVYDIGSRAAPDAEPAVDEPEVADEPAAEHGLAAEHEPEPAPEPPADHELDAQEPPAGEAVDEAAAEETSPDIRDGLEERRWLDGPAFEPAGPAGEEQDRPEEASDGRASLDDDDLDPGPPSFELVDVDEAGPSVDDEVAHDEEAPDAEELPDAEEAQAPDVEDASGGAEPGVAAAAADPADRKPSVWPPKRESATRSGSEMAASGASGRPGDDLRGGLRVLDELLEFRPGSVDLLARKAAYARRLGDERLLVESWVELARELEGRGGSRGARLLALRALELDPDSHEAREMLRPMDRAVSGMARFGDRPENRLLDLEAPEARTELERRVVSEFTKEVGALRWLEAATEVTVMSGDELPAEFYRFFGRYLMARGEWEDAAKVFEHLAGRPEILDAGEHPELVFGLALIYRKLGRHEHAMHCFRRLAGVEESFRTAWAALPEAGDG